jgi:hypothetical protein
MPFESTFVITEEVESDNQGCGRHHRPMHSTARFLSEPLHCMLRPLEPNSEAASSGLKEQTYSLLDRRQEGARKNRKQF